MHPATNRSARAALDAEAWARLASAPLQTRVLKEKSHEACADRIVAVRCIAGTGAADRAEHQFRLRAKSAQAAAQLVFRRGIRRRAEFQGSYLRAVARQHVGPGLCRRRHAT